MYTITQSKNNCFRNRFDKKSTTETALQLRFSDYMTSRFAICINFSTQVFDLKNVLVIILLYLVSDCAWSSTRTGCKEERVYEVGRFLSLFMLMIVTGLILSCSVPRVLKAVVTKKKSIPVLREALFRWVPVLKRGTAGIAYDRTVDILLYGRII